MDPSHRCCNKQKVKKGFWSPEEDEKLITHITTHGHSSWSSVPRLAGLERCGKSCRLRWVNYLRPNLKKGIFTPEEEQIIIDVHRIIGNKWAQIAKHLPGRTDNEVKNFWNSCIKKKLISLGLDPNTHNLISSTHHQMTSKASNFMIDFMKFQKTRNYQEEEEEEEPNSIFSVVPDNINLHVMSRVLNSTSTDSAEIIMSPTTSLPDHPQLVLNNNIMTLQNQYPPASCEYFPIYPLEMDSLPNILSDQFPSSSSSRVTTTINPFETNTFLLEKSTQQLQNINIGRDDEMLWDTMINIDKFVEEDSSRTMLQSQQHQDIAVFYDYQTFDQF